MIAGPEGCGRGVGLEPDRIASAVVEVVFDSHPAHLSVEEVIREVAPDPAKVGERCDVADAIRDLAGVGLLHRSGEFVFATRAAVRAAELGI